MWNSWYIYCCSAETQLFFFLLALQFFFFFSWFIEYHFKFANFALLLNTSVLNSSDVFVPVRLSWWAKNFCFLLIYCWVLGKGGAQLCCVSTGMQKLSWEVCICRYTFTYTYVVYTYRDPSLSVSMVLYICVAIV